MRFGFVAALPTFLNALEEHASLIQATKMEAQVMFHQGHGVHKRGTNAKKLVKMTKKMEKEYESTALDVANGEDVPTATLSSIKELMETVAQQVQSEHDEDDTQAGILRDAIEQCNTNCLADQNNATSGVAFYDNAANNAATLHSQCRENEIVEEGNSTQHCDSYTNGGNSARQTKNHCDCSFQEDTAPDNILTCIEQQATWANDHKAKLEVLKTACDDATDVYTTAAQDCDDKQKNYESIFCELAMKKDQVCGQLDTCRQQQIDEFNQICDEIEIVAETRKAVWQSIEKIKCYVAVMIKAEQQNITTASVDACIQLDIDTTHLDFTRPQIPGKVDCPLEASRPGSDAWASDARYPDRWSGLETVTACAGVPTPPRA